MPLVQIPTPDGRPGPIVDVPDDQVQPGDRIVGPSPTPPPAGGGSQTPQPGAGGTTPGQPGSVTPQQIIADLRAGILSRTQAQQALVNYYVSRGMGAMEAATTASNLLSEVPPDVGMPPGGAPPPTTPPDSNIPPIPGQRVEPPPPRDVVPRTEPGPVPPPTSVTPGVPPSAASPDLPFELTRDEQLEQFLNERFNLSGVVNPAVRRGIGRLAEFTPDVFDILQPGGGTQPFQEFLQQSFGRQTPGQIRGALTNFLSADPNDPNNLLAELLTNPNASTLAGAFAPTLRAAGIPRLMELAPSFRDAFRRRLSRFGEGALLQDPTRFETPQDVLRFLQERGVF